MTEPPGPIPEEPTGPIPEEPTDPVYVQVNESANRIVGLMRTTGPAISAAVVAWGVQWLVAHDLIADDVAEKYQNLVQGVVTTVFIAIVVPLVWLLARSFEDKSKMPYKILAGIIIWMPRPGGPQYIGPDGTIQKPEGLK